VIRKACAHRSTPLFVATSHYQLPCEQPVKYFAPKLFTATAGEKVVENKSFKSRALFPLSPSFLDRTVAARRPEISRREHGWDNPG
jgi:hypothetical protein